MNQPGRQFYDNGPTVEGRIPARPEYPYEECYQFAAGKMGYRRSCWSNGQFVFEFNVPGIYRVFAWIERDGQTISGTQTCVFELVAPTASPSVTMGC